ncbi:MAG TPA: NAD-dependent epimerase/dehydratase family protein [Desulfobacteraceae bacterium]|nr:NAD-dependent epimerase/dehydratase family protein [Desulfobacteraceae bacterium]
MKKKILITGGAGFLGTNFVTYMLDRYPDYELIVLDALTYAGSLDNFSPQVKENPAFTFYHGDTRNADLVLDLMSGVNMAIHLAAETHVARSIYDNRKFFETDVLGTQSVANAVLKNINRIERFIHISTSEVYGTAMTRPMCEDHPINPMSPYAAAKAGGDRLVYSYWRTYDIPAVILRPFNQYGPYQHLEKVIPRFITSALLGEPLTIHGNGEARRDWLHVEDTCKRIDRALHAPDKNIRGEVFNLGSGFDMSILSVARMILDVLGKPESLIAFMADRPGQVQHHISSTEKAERVLCIEPGRKFEEGLEQAVKWYAENRNWWERLLPMRRVEILTRDGNSEYY